MISLPEMKALHARACEAAAEAFAGAVCQPMIVGSPRDLVGSLMGGDGGGIDPEQPTYYVADGVCGFGWVNIKPANSRFANFLRKEGYGRTDSYEGGLRLSSSTVCGQLSQSLARNEAAVYAYASVLREAGIKAYGCSRVD